MELYKKHINKQKKTQNRYQNKTIRQIWKIQIKLLILTETKHAWNRTAFNWNDETLKWQIAENKKKNIFTFHVKMSNDIYIWNDDRSAWALMVEL